MSKAAARGEGPKPLNWSSLFWELTAFYPGQFNRETFSDELVSTVLTAYSAMRKLQDEEMRRLELPQANIAATVAQVQGAKVKLGDFLIYGRTNRLDDGFPPLAAAIAVSLKADGLCPHPLIGVWPSIIEAVGRNNIAQLPERRLLQGTTEGGGRVWVLGPEWEGAHIRGVLCTYLAAPGAEVELVDADRPLLAPRRYRLPQFRACVQMVEAKALLLAL